MRRRAIGVGIAAAIGFLLIANHFRCCQGEDGFAQNASIGGLVLFGLLVVALFAQPAWRDRPILRAATALAWWLAAGATILAARPPLDDYVFGRSLHLGWRTLAVFAAATVASYVLSLAAARIDERRGPGVRRGLGGQA